MSLPTVVHILSELDKSLVEFGTYDYYDKGVDEVHELPFGIVEELRKLSSGDVSTYLNDIKKHEHGEHLASYILSLLETDVTVPSWIDDIVKKTGLIY